MMISRGILYSSLGTGLSDTAKSQAAVGIIKSLPKGKPSFYPPLEMRRSRGVGGTDSGRTNENNNK